MKTLESPIGTTDQTSQGKGWIVSLIAHIVIIALLFLPVLVQSPPIEEEEGLLVSLGLPDEGQGEEPPMANESKAQPEPSAEPVDHVKEVTSRAPVKQVSEKIVTTNDDDAIAVREAQAKKKAQAEANERAAEEARKQQAYNNTKKSYGDLLGGSGKGNTGKPGSQGDPSGDPNAGALEGISKGSGRVGGGLNGRGVVHEPRISDGSQKTGRVVISVCVDKNGKVIKADYTQKGSTTTDSELKDIARRAALQFKFTESEVQEQCGTITVDFKIKGQ